MEELTVLGAPAERADAARNRVRILTAAESLFASRGVQHVSMDDVALAAGVGKGTLYRRFGDKAGLGAAVLDARERDLQAAILSGPPPLGPGAPPYARLHAFVDAYLDYLYRNLDLVVMSETAAPGARYRSGVYAGWRLHLRVLLEAAGAPAPHIMATYLLAGLAGDLHQHLDRQGETDQARAGLHRLVDVLAHPPSR
jgi:AcrR family transcriptional regulator